MISNRPRRPAVDHHVLPRPRAVPKPRTIIEKPAVSHGLITLFTNAMRAPVHFDASKFPRSPYSSGLWCKRKNKYQLPIRYVTRSNLFTRYYLLSAPSLLVHFKCDAMCVGYPTSDDLFFLFFPKANGFTLPFFLFQSSSVLSRSVSKTWLHIGW